MRARGGGGRPHAKERGLGGTRPPTPRARIRRDGLLVLKSPGLWGTSWPPGHRCSWRVCWSTVQGGDRGSAMQLGTS